MDSNYKMFHLPPEIIRYIFEYDSTYREMFKKVLHSRYEIYQNKKTKNYFIFDLFSGKSYVTDHFERPTWKTRHHTHKNKNTKGSFDLYLENFKEKMMIMYDLEKLKNVKIDRILIE